MNKRLDIDSKGKDIIQIKYQRLYFPINFSKRKESISDNDKQIYIHQNQHCLMFPIDPFSPVPDEYTNYDPSNSKPDFSGQK
jgi:hypothetical protein